MKRRKRKKVTAMGLAVVMAATVPMQVFATEGVEENTQVNEQVNEQADVTGSAVGNKQKALAFNLMLRQEQQRLPVIPEWTQQL